MASVAHSIVAFLKKRKGRSTVSRFLWATGLCRVFSIHLAHQVRMRFFPTSLSAALWIDSSAYLAEEKFILAQLKTGDTFIDVGANVEHLTLLAGQRVGRSGSVIAIEAHPRTFGFLCKNVRLNGFQHVRLINSAVGSHAGEAGISDFRADDMNHLSQVGGIKIPVITLDSLGISVPVALLKTDTEGFEPFVFEGARHLLARVRCVYFECSEWNLKRYGRSSSELKALLESAGFDIYQPRGDRLLPIDDSDYDPNAGGNLVALRKTQ